MPLPEPTGKMMPGGLPFPSSPETPTLEQGMGNRMPPADILGQVRGNKVGN